MGKEIVPTQDGDIDVIWTTRIAVIIRTARPLHSFYHSASSTRISLTLVSFLEPFMFRLRHFLYSSR